MRFEGLDLNLLVALDAILEERSVIGASRRLHLSQPAMSAAIGRLRQYFNDEIFTISKRKLVPTPLAQSLEKPTRDILLRIRTNLISPPKFDPANSERRFRLVVSDYASIVLMHAVMKRVYPRDQLAAQVLGQVGTEGQALSGIELARESVLHGRTGERRVVSDARQYRAAPSRDKLERLLTEKRGNIAAVAKALDRKWNVVQRWLRKSGIDADRFRE